MTQTVDAATGPVSVERCLASSQKTILGESVSSNPYISPEAVTPSPPPDVPNIVGLRHLCANIALFALVLIGGTILDAIDVMVGQPHENGFDYLGPILGFLVIGTVYSVNWRLTYTNNWRLRSIIAAGLTLVATAVGFVPYGLYIIWFHLHIGGTL